MNTTIIKKEAGKQGLSLLAILGGFLVANFAIKTIKMDNLMSNLVITIAGYTISVMVPNEHVQDAAKGLASFGFIKLLNNLTAPAVPVGIKGLDGFTLPASVASLIQQFVPTLGTVSIGSASMGIVNMAQNANGVWQARSLAGLKGTLQLPVLGEAVIANEAIIPSA